MSASLRVFDRFPPASYRSLTIPDGIRAAALRSPNKVALIEGQRRLTYAALWGRIERLASALTESGVVAGERAAIMSRNCLEFVEAVCAIALCGGAAVLINPRYTAEEAGYVCSDGDARVLFVHPDVEEVARSAEINCVEQIVTFGTMYEDWITASRPHSTFPVVEEWDPFALVYTSGTTGKPKGVILSHRARTLTFLAMASEYGCYSPDDVSIAVAPLYHGGGLSFALAPLFLGGSCAILPRFDPEGLLDSVSSISATNVFLVPTHFHKIFALGSSVLRKYDLRSLRTIISNAAPLPQATKEEIIEQFGGGVLHETYGSTEASIVSNLRPSDQLTKRESVGLPFAATEVRLLDSTGNEVEIGETGELFSRSPYLFNGYWRQPETTARAYKGEWFSAGDLARRDGDGYLYIVGRTDDMVISGGVNIYPREIEEVLAHHPGVADVAVIGLPDDYWGQALVAFIVPRRSMATSAEDLTMYCREHLAAFKVPKHFEVVSTLPRSEAGKVLRRELRDSAVRGPA